MIDMGARRFLPDVGRFLQLDLFHGAWENRSLGADPINQNRYSLAAGNPISYIESDGHLVLTRPLQTIHHRLSTTAVKGLRVRRRSSGRRVPRT